MKNQYTQLWCILAGPLLFADVGLGSPAGACDRRPGPLSTTESTFQDPTWIEQVVFLLERLYLAIGGDLSKFQSQPTLSDKLVLVAGHYMLYGIPRDLSIAQKDALIADIDTLYETLRSPAPDAPREGIDPFLGVLARMWDDLGMPAPELGGDPHEHPFSGLRAGR